MVFTRSVGLSESGDFHGQSGASTLQYNRDDNDKIWGSLVTDTGDIIQLSVDYKGDEIAEVTPSEDFPAEEEDDADDGPARHLRGKSTSILGPKVAAAISDPRQLNEITVLDIMVVYTAEAECKNSGLAVGCTRTATTEANILSRVNLAVTETNTAFELSGVIARLNLVHATYIQYTETIPDGTNNPFADALNGLHGTNDGIMDEVHDLRTQYGADIVAMLIGTTTSCGRAKMGPAKANMFSVTAYNCATGYYSFGHEIAHNMGCRHDKGTTNACSSNDYQYGFRDPEGEFRTILAYACKTDQCDNIAATTPCTRIQRFSTSDQSILYNGKVLGTSTVDNARKLNENAAIVAGYYGPTPAPSASPTAPTSSPSRNPTPPPVPLADCTSLSKDVCESYSHCILTGKGRSRTCVFSSPVATPAPAPTTETTPAPAPTTETTPAPVPTPTGGSIDCSIYTSSKTCPDSCSWSGKNKTCS